MLSVDGAPTRPGADRTDTAPVAAPAAGRDRDTSPLCEPAWIFGTAEGVSLSPQLTLEPDGEIGGVSHPDAWRWTLTDGEVRFADRAGAVRLAFVRSPEASPERAILERRDPATGAPTHYLIQTERFTRLARPEEAEPLTPLSQPRRNLVVLRADATSLHTRWARDLGGQDRTWDLCVSWYGSAESFEACGPAEYTVLQNVERKFPSLHRLCYPGSPIFDYDHVAFPDDDIEITWGGMNELFSVAAEHRLALCQPALTADSFISHAITRQQPGQRLRYTNFVEVMVPVFSKAALARCAGSFLLSPSAWGLDFIWPQILGGHRHRVAVIDAVGVRHTRPAGQAYDMQAAQADADRLIQAYQADPGPREYGALL